MRKTKKIPSIERIIDANINRLKEGLRVCEEITRFILDNRPLTSAFKKIRHEIDSLILKGTDRKKMFLERRSFSDVGRDIHQAHEFKRKNIEDVFFANIQRVKESLRVLEEFLKLSDTGSAAGFKKIRYNVYELEKKAAVEIGSLRYHR